MRSAVQRWCWGEREKEKQAAGSQMAGQWKHLFGPDWQIWRAGGWKLACHSSLQSGRCSCSLSSLLLHFSQYFWASAAQNVEFHSQSVNAIKARGSSSPWVFFFWVFFLVQDLLYCGRHTPWLSFCLHPSLILSRLCCTRDPPRP